MWHGDPWNPTLLHKPPPRRTQHAGQLSLTSGLGPPVLGLPQSFSFSLDGPTWSPSLRSGGILVLGSFCPQSVAPGCCLPFRVPPTPGPKVFLYRPWGLCFMSDLPKLHSKFSKIPSNRWCFNTQTKFHIIYAAKHRKKSYGPTNTAAVTELNLGGSEGV